LEYLIIMIEMGIKAIYEGTLYREQLITTLKNVRLYYIASQIYHIAQLISRHLKRLKNRLFPGTIILLYHRVINLKTDPQLLAVSPEHFYEHMKYLKNNYSIISLDDLKRAMNSGKIPKKSIVRELPVNNLPILIIPIDTDFTDLHRRYCRIIMSLRVESKLKN